MKLFSNTYYQLISSLPPLPPRLDAGRLPISRERLQDRLRMLEPEDHAEMERMMKVLAWSRQFEERDDLAVVRKYDALMQNIVNPLVREVLTAMLDVQMITTALRRRRRGLGPPPVGIGRWSGTHPPSLQRARLRAGPCLSWYLPNRSAARAGDILKLHRASWRRHGCTSRSTGRLPVFQLQAVVLTSRDGTFAAGQRWSRAEAGRSLRPFGEVNGTCVNIYSEARLWDHGEHRAWRARAAHEKFRRLRARGR
jgi:hypothetical protein